ncbi:TetR/AcrR family transcriptional regulator C-terminal domain-containing protein [Streptomyces sp. 549]|uniref:TetR/AcrR family transcriptional regulator n=1 Tax=Streptomyces sp. 549 TaxID=3049076 RepID=UPI0024C45EC6|nr:TetR/AcrR family transcriptional regulator C-terminal domain-containing protein [Streptomyces sp. 549]MDK1476314.1 TetR/AcrR family transcriptional regulator C-terminal domain-containing protein [Streptomyces sp. 549]
MVVFAGQGDARRSMALLWREQDTRPQRTGPGPKPALSVDTIVDTAIAHADAHGMAALSMRAVGNRLGRTAMALYTYVPSKSELLDLMHDRALAELPTRYDMSGGWRPALETWAGDLLAFYLRHPWMLQVSQARPVLGPHEFVFMETLLGVLHATGLPPRRQRGIVGALVHFVRGAAQTIADSREATAATGMSDDEWWYARSAMLEEVAPDFAERFPILTRLESQHAFDPADEDAPYLEHEARDAFATGLTVLLDGITTAVTAFAAVRRAGGGADGQSPAADVRG